MRHVKYLALTTVFAFGSIATVRAADTIKLANVVELSGPGASVGVLWGNAVHMAADDINAKGGILGQKIEVTDYDTQTNPSVSRSAVQKALDDGPYAVVGPIYSGSVKVNMQLTQAAKIAQFTGAAAADITQMNNPYIFRMAFSQTNSMPRVARYIAEDLKAKTVAVVWVNDDMGKGGHETIAPEFEKRGLKVVADLPNEANQASFTPDVVKIRGA